MSLGRIGSRAVVVGLGVLALGVFGVSAASAATLTVCETGPPTCGYKHIQEAINEAKSGDTIEIAAGTYDELLAIPGSGSATSLSLQGAGAGKTTIDGTESGTVVAISSHETVTITGVTVTQGNVNFATEGGGIFNGGGTLTLTNSQISNNFGSEGGGIDNQAGTVTVNNSTLTENDTSASGGGIYNGGGTVTVNNSRLSHNGASFGGGIFNEGGTVAVNHSTLTENKGETHHHSAPGGGIYNASGGTVVLRNSAVTDNFATEGGGIFNEGTVSGTHDTILGNKPNGITNVNGGTVNLKNSEVQEP
jgi:hypothetical protein